MKTFDIDNLTHQREILLRSKSARLEGICAEHILQENLLGDVRTSSNWWFERRLDSYAVTKLLHSVDDLTLLDMVILNHFVIRQIPVSITLFNDKNSGFTTIDYQKVDTLVNLKQRLSLLTDFQPIEYTKVIPFQKDQRRLLKTLDYIQDRGWLHSAAIDRLYADFLIRNRFFWDVDTFVFRNGSLCVLEGKQRYPIPRTHTFGLNDGLVRLFDFLKSMGIRIYHIMLTKPVWDDQFDAIDCFTDSRYAQDSWWIAAEYDRSILLPNTSIAPIKTSLRNNKNVEYHHVPVNHFVKLGSLADDPNRITYQLSEYFLNPQYFPFLDRNAVPQIPEFKTPNDIEKTIEPDRKSKTLNYGRDLSTIPLLSLK